MNAQPPHHAGEWPVRFAVSTAQLQGSRGRQEDAYCTHFGNDYLIAFVADGLGGHERGDEASRQAISHVIAALKEQLRYRDFVADLALREAFHGAHEVVRNLGRAAGRIPTGTPPATTLAGGIFFPELAEVLFANVGDSLIYVLRRNVLSPAFSVEGEAGWVRFALGDDVGGRYGRGIQLLPAPLKLFPGDRVLLATDGIATLDQGAIRAHLQQQDARTACEALVRAILERANPNQDNTTLLVVDALDGRNAGAADVRIG